MEDEHDTPGHDHKKMSKAFNNERKLFKQYLAGDHSVMLPESINEAKLRLKVKVPIRDPEAKKFIHNYLLLNKKYSMSRMPEYSMKFGGNKWKKETHWKYDTANNILYVHDAKVVDILVKGKAPSDLFESNLNEGKGQVLADKYVAKLRSEFRKLNDDELDEFKKTIAQSLDLNESIKELVNEAAIPKLEKELEKVILKYMKDKEHTIPNITQTVKLFPFSKFAKYYKTKKAAGLAEPQVEGKVNEGLKVKDWHEETRPDKIVIKTSNGKTLEITPKRSSSEKSYQAWLQILDQYKTNSKAASHVDKTITQMANESVNEARKEKIFKKGAKVKYLSNPGVITSVHKDVQGRVWYDVKYTNSWGKNWTSADMILSTAGSITEGKLNEAPSIWKKLDQIMDLRMKSMDVEQNIMDRERELKRLYQGQEQEAEPEGGRISNRYAKDIESLTKILNKDKAILKYILKKIDKLDQF